MTDDDGQHHDQLAPNNRDRARALRIVLAMMSKDLDDVKNVIAEPQNAGDVTHLILALADEVAMAVKRRPDTNPFRFVQDRIQHFLGEAEKHGE